MATPESNRSNWERWEEFLKDVDMSGVSGPGSLIDRIYSVESGTPKQNAVYQMLRASIEPFERYFHNQAESFAFAKKLPKGVRKEGNDYWFDLVFDDDHFPVHFSLQKGANRWSRPWVKGNNRCLMRIFELDSSLIIFNNKGNINEVTLSTSTRIPIIAVARDYYIPENSDVCLYVHSPSDMGLYTVRENRQKVHSRVLGNGILDSFTWSNEALTDENKRYLFVLDFVDAIKAICPAQISS